MTDKPPSEAYRERVYEAFADRRRPFSDAVTDALSAGCDRLGVGIGFLTQVTDDTQYVEDAVGDHESIQPGAECPLEEAYCRRTVELDGLLSVQDAEASPEVSDTAYEAFGLGSYIGCKVIVDDEVYGTVCFADHDSRGRPFSEAEELFVELVARLVGRAIERRTYERERAEQTAQLTAEKRRFEGIAENSFDVIFRVDTESRFTYVSKSVTRVLGYDPEALLGEPFLEHLTSASTVDALDRFDELLAGEPVQGLELTFQRSDGSTAVVEINATPVTDDGTVTEIQGVGRDVTERRERETELRVRTRAIEDAGVPITIADATDPDNPVVYVNEAFETVTGYSRSEFVGRNCRALQGPETNRDDAKTLAAGIGEGRPVSTEILNYRRDGSPFWNHVSVTPIEDDSGRITHYLGFQQDITERKRRERLIGLLNRVLRHNLRNELTVIQGYADFVTDPPPDTDVAAGLRRPVERLIALSERARELETYARDDRRPQRIDPGGLLRSVAANHTETDPEATITARTTTDRAICAGSEVERAVDELVTNALDHDPDPDTTVELTARDDGEWIEIVVRDDGPGIPAMEAAVVKTGEETDLQHGRGLGLWLVNWIVTRYGGSFQLDADDGTVATLRLPAIEPDQALEDAVRRPTVLFR